MNTRSSIRSVQWNWFVLLGFLLAGSGCGGGGGAGGGGTLSSSAGTVQVSMAAAPGFPAGASFTASPASVDPAAKPASPSFDNVWVEIWKVALLPSKEGDGPDSNGEVLSPDDSSDRSGSFVAVELPADRHKVINLLDLPSGQAVARFLNRIENVPAGTYGKIRVYYSSLWGERVRDGQYERVDFHPTANSHFDVHFVDGNLVIPVGTDVGGGVRLYDVTIRFVGLKIVENPNKVLMRPQVFATVAEPVRYVVSGFADNVMTGAFDVSPSGVHVTFSMDNDVTHWGFKDNETLQQVAVDNSLGIAALRDGSLVDVYGAFPSTDTLFVADKVVVIFTDSTESTVAPGDAPPSGWQSASSLEFFEFRFSGDNVVIPMPSRTEARYDNNSIQHPTLSDAIIVDNTCVRARGYFVTEGIEAFWISWLGDTPCPP